MPIDWPSRPAAGAWEMPEVNELISLARPEIRALEPYASARKTAGDDGLLLNANENPWPPAARPDSRLNRYPEPQPAELRQRLSDYCGVAPASLLITRGSDEGIDLLVRTFCRPGRDAVSVCPPCFALYALSARIQGAPVHSVPLVAEAEGHVIDEAGLAAAAARLTFLCSPNNPTGDEVPADGLERLVTAARGRGLVVVDEAYLEFSGRESFAGLLDRWPNLVVLRTLSKAFGLAGCRLGVVLAHPEVIDLLGRVIPPYPLPAPAVEAGLEALGPEGIREMRRQVAEIMAGKAELVAGLQAHPGIHRVWPGAANFVLAGAADGPALVAAAGDAGIRLRDVSDQPGLENGVRITLGRPAENRRLLEFLEQWRPA